MSRNTRRRTPPRSVTDTKFDNQEMVMELLRLNRDYLTRHASPHTRADLTRFLRDRGIALDWFIDMHQLTTLGKPAGADHSR